MKKWFLVAFGLFGYLGSSPLGCRPARAVTLQQVLSREHPDLNVRDAGITIGRDGLVYLASKTLVNHPNYNGLVLRLERDGSHKTPADSGPAAWGNVTANAAGVVAVPRQHFQHALALLSPTFAPIAAVSDFLNNDAVGYDAPAHVEAGASGDFYAVDQSRDRILRISPTGKVVAAYAIPHQPADASGRTEQFRVNEKLQEFWTYTRAGQWSCVGFDGHTHWSYTLGSPFFDVDEDGTTFFIDARDDTLKKLSGEGKPAGDTPLQMGVLKASLDQFPITGLRVWNGEVLLKRAHPTELFQRYDLTSGKLLNVAVADYEKLAVTYPGDVWTAGEEEPFDLQFTTGGRALKPRWHVWLRPLNAPLYRELRREAGKVLVPADAAGIYQLKVTPETQPLEKGGESEYLLRAWIEIRQPNSRGTVNVMSPLNRSYFAAGDTIPLSVLVRTAGNKSVPLTIRLSDGKADGKAGGTVIAETKATPDAGGVFALALPASLTSALRPGNYAVTASAPDFTSVAQNLVLGSGDVGTTFFAIHHGDYGPTYPSGSLWSAPDVVSAYVDRESRLGFNFFADRIGSPLEIESLHWGGTDAQAQNDLAKKLDTDAAGVAPDTVRTASVLNQVMAAYSARGIHEMPILFMMDAGLPMGVSGFDGRKPDELQRDLARVTTALLPYRSFRGWTWHANWWLYANNGSAAAKTPDEKTAYEAALQKARETGAWDPVLDRVAGYRLGYAVETQDFLAHALQKVAPNADLVTASAGPYRNINAYPPVSFQNVDEVDLQGQFEQIALPYFAPHAVDFYRRPGKPVWGHPEVWNDSGTGEQIMPTLFSMFMRGTDGAGASGPVPPWSGGSYGLMREDARSSHYGNASIFRATNALFRRYGTWLRDLKNDDRVAIAVSARPFKIDDWTQGTTGRHFARVMEAWVSCLHAHHPASFVFAEDLKPDSFKQFKAILVVGQTVEMEPALLGALKSAQGTGAKVYADGTCRPDAVKDFSPLGIAFDKFEKDPAPAADDAAYYRLPQDVKANLPVLQKALDTATPPVAKIENPEVWASQRTGGAGRFLFVVNNTTPPFELGQIWRTTTLQASRWPVTASLGLTETAPAIYDVLAMKKVAASSGMITADLRDLPMRIYALLPAAIGGVALRGPVTLESGQNFAWWTQVRDSGGKALDAPVPVRVRLLAADGSVLHETSLSSAGKGIGGAITVPLNVAGDLTLEATELFSGHSVRLPITAKAIKLPVAPDSKFSVAPPQGSGTAAPADIEPTVSDFGPHARDMTVSENGKIAVINTNNWNGNLQGIDTATGQALWRNKIGDYFAFEPRAVNGGFVAQGFDYASPEGYHLYLADEAGHVARRFALYGLPRRLPHRFVPGLFLDRDDPIDNFAVPDDGSWIASAGDLGLAVWSRDGKLLWQQDWWKAKRHTARLSAPDAGTVFVAPTGEGIEVAADDAKTGKVKWSLTLAPSGIVQKIEHSKDGRTIALQTTYNGGHIFLLRDGKLLNTLPTAGLDMALSPDGERVAVIERNQLKLYGAADGLRWTFAGDDLLRKPRFSPDGKRVAAGSELGTVYILGEYGTSLFEQDNKALTTPAWLPDGDLLLANWMGKVTRLDAAYKPKWSTLLSVPQGDKPVSDAGTPTLRIADWSTGVDKPLPLTPNLLAETKAVVRLDVEDHPTAQFTQPYESLSDGKPDAPKIPWLSWTDVNRLAEGSPATAVVFDGFRTQMRLEAITFVEDPAHPESWLHDGRLEYWDTKSEQWVAIMNLLSDAATHTHRLPHPVEAGKFRVVIPPGLYGNLRWGEVVLHGKALGASHPDVIAKRPLAVLFDESDEFKDEYPYMADRWNFQLEGAYAGRRFLQVNADQYIAPRFLPAFGETVPTWDFEIAETPQPGQYRWLQFAFKGLAPGAKGATLRFDGARLYAGEPSGEDFIPAHKVADAVTGQWQTVRVDLWDVYKKPVRIQTMHLGALGGPVGFDQIVLGRTEADLPPLK